jgi:hypothetical protein
MALSSIWVGAVSGKVCLRRSSKRRLPSHISHAIANMHKSLSHLCTLFQAQYLQGLGKSGYRNERCPRRLMIETCSKKAIPRHQGAEKATIVNIAPITALFVDELY